MKRFTWAALAVLLIGVIPQQVAAETPFVDGAPVALPSLVSGVDVCPTCWTDPDKPGAFCILEVPILDGVMCWFEGGHVHWFPPESTGAFLMPFMFLGVGFPVVEEEMCEGEQIGIPGGYEQWYSCLPADFQAICDDAFEYYQGSGAFVTCDNQNQILRVLH